MTVDVVIASYREPVDWLWLLPESWRIFLYNTDEARTVFPADTIETPTGRSSRYTLERIRNGGREAGQWLHHLAYRYGDHSDVTLFLQGEPFDHEAKKLLRLIHGQDFCYPICYVGGWPPQKGAVTLKPFPDVIEILKKGWGEEPIAPLIGFGVGAQFYVKREVILARPREHYAGILENAYDPAIHSFGHRMEPCWGAVFDWEKFA